MRLLPGVPPRWRVRDQRVASPPWHRPAPPRRGGPYGGPGGSRGGPFRAVPSRSGACAPSAHPRRNSSRGWGGAWSRAVHLEVPDDRLDRLALGRIGPHRQHPEYHVGVAPEAEELLAPEDVPEPRAARGASGVALWSRVMAPGSRLPHGTVHGAGGAAHPVPDRAHAEHLGTGTRTGVGVGVRGSGPQTGSVWPSSRWITR